MYPTTTIKLKKKSAIAQLPPLWVNPNPSSHLSLVNGQVKEDN